MAMSNEKLALCACGCGELCIKKWKRGHIGRTPEGRKKISTYKYDDDELFVIHEDKQRNMRATHRFHMIRKEEGELRCDICNTSTWMGAPVPLVIDHKNGLRYDDRLENLRLVCRNCDGQLPTFAGRNIGKYN